MSDSESRHAALHRELEALRKAKATLDELFKPIRKLHVIVEEWEKVAGKPKPLPMQQHHSPPAMGENLGAIDQNPRAIIDAYNTWAIALDKFFSAYNALEPKEKASMPLDLIEI